MTGLGTVIFGVALLGMSAIAPVSMSTFLVSAGLSAGYALTLNDVDFAPSDTTAIELDE